MEREKKTARGAKLQLNRQAGLASEAIEVGFTVGCQDPHAMKGFKNLGIHTCATCEINMYDLRNTTGT